MIELLVHPDYIVDSNGFKYACLGGCRLYENIDDIRVYNRDIFFNLVHEWVEFKYAAKPVLPCYTCEGTGVTNACPECEGSGEVYLENDYNSYEWTCETCNGKKVLKDDNENEERECPGCNGSLTEMVRFERILIKPELQSILTYLGDYDEAKIFKRPIRGIDYVSHEYYIKSNKFLLVLKE